MRIDAQDVDVRRQHVAIVDGVVGLTGGNVDRLGLELDRERRVRGRPIRKEQADARLDDFGRAGRQHVQLHDEVAAALERPRSVGRLHERRLARRPAVDVLHLVVGHRGEARLAVARDRPSARRATDRRRRSRGAGSADCRRGTRSRARSASTSAAPARRSCGRRPCRWPGVDTPPASAAPGPAGRAASRPATSAAAACRPASPSTAPSSAQRWMIAIWSSRSPRAFANAPAPRSGSHGGMMRRAVASAICFACSRTSRYSIRLNGAPAKHH